MFLERFFFFKKDRGKERGGPGEREKERDRLGQVGDIRV
jgi:hypothetical protein